MTMLLDDTTLSAFRAEVLATYPHLARRYASDLRATRVPQPWLDGVEVLRIETTSPPGAQLFAARRGGATVLLSGRLDRLAELAAAAPPAIADADAARAYAMAVDGWTVELGVQPRHLASWDDLRWTATRPGDAERIRRLTAQHRADVAPATATRDGDGWRVEVWATQSFALVRRTLRVDAAGGLRRDDEVVAEDLPLVER